MQRITQGGRASAERHQMFSSDAGAETGMSHPCWHQHPSSDITKRRAPLFSGAHLSSSGWPQTSSTSVYIGMSADVSRVPDNLYSPAKVLLEMQSYVWQMHSCRSCAMLQGMCSCGLHCGMSIGGAQVKILLCDAARNCEEGCMGAPCKVAFPSGIVSSPAAGEEK